MDREDIKRGGCALCEYASPIADTDNFVCKLKGVVGHDFKCRKYKFDPIKISPRLPARKLQYNAEDFAIS